MNDTVTKDELLAALTAFGEGPEALAALKQKWRENRKQYIEMLENGILDDFRSRPVKDIGRSKE